MPVRGRGGLPNQILQTVCSNWVEPVTISEDTQLCFKHRNLGHGGGQPRISMPIPWHDYDQKDNCDGKNA
jgi:hypothetical protein